METNSISINKFTKTADSLDNYISYKASKGKSQTVPAIYNNQIRVYQNGGIFTVYSNNSKINSIVLGSAMQTKVSYKINGNTYEKSISAGGRLELSNLDLTEVEFTCIGKNKTSRLYVNYLSVSYTI